VTAAAVPQPRWITETGPDHSQWYIERFRQMAADGNDLGGEARFIDAMLPRRGARVLDAGCGPGRVSGYLHAAGHQVVGVDVDPELIAAAEQDHPGPTYYVADLATFDLSGSEDRFDGAVLAGNVMVFLGPDTEADVLRRVAAHVVPQGFIAVGFHTNRHLSLEQFDKAVVAAGLQLEYRFATWHVHALTDDSDFAVSVLRHAD